jgi:hypothetical protein
MSTVQVCFGEQAVVPVLPEDRKELQAAVTEYLEENAAYLTEQTFLIGGSEHKQKHKQKHKRDDGDANSPCRQRLLQLGVEHVRTYVPNGGSEGSLRVPGWEAEYVFFLFQLNSEGEAEEYAEEDSGEGGGSPTVACHEWQLPAVEFDGVWNTLFYDAGVKDKLLRYASSSLLFSDCLIDPKIVSCNRLVLLHGPPGTGKTTLCQALAQKLSIRFGARFKHSQMLEINSHSLFSKWFSESGKLIQRLFQRIQEAVEEEDTMVVN